MNRRVRTYVSIVVLLCGFFSTQAQNAWTWTELPSMPEPVSNNAVTSAYSGDSLCVYSFTGIDASKIPSGIHLKCWRYNTVSEEWSALEDVPDFQGKIAASAVTINNLIYLLGGYYVNEDLSEVSSDDLHVFDPDTNQWLDDAATIPVAIDDHVYDVWRDSLMYVVTGWSDSGNVRDVQIYDPANDLWEAANDLPFTESYAVFGGSGSIIGDTIFYIGGVNNSFNTMSRLRKGIIDPEDPTNIEWSVVGECPEGDVYRSASMSYDETLFFVGGSDDGYNFDGISYATDEGVEAQSRILAYYPQWDFWETDIEAPYGVMDLRGIAQIDETSWIICGGMTGEQEVSDSVYLLEYSPILSIDPIETFDLNAYFSDNQLHYTSDFEVDRIEVYSAVGKLLAVHNTPNQVVGAIPFNFKTGHYTLRFFHNNGVDFGVVSLVKE